VKFKIFKRLAGDAVVQAEDRKLLRFKNVAKLSVSDWAMWLSHQPYFEAFVFFFIILSTIIQGTQIQLEKSENAVLFEIMELLDDIALVVFALEIIVKWIDSFTRFWTDGWNVFDFVTTILSAIPRVIDIFLTGSKTGNLQNISSQLRLFRTMRVLKMIAKVQSLKLVITTVIDAFASLGFILLLLLLLTYMFGIFSINLFLPYTNSLQEGLLYQDKFKDLPTAFITLFQILTLDQWFVIQADIQKAVNPTVVVCFFVFWVWIGAFVFRNVFVGVMVKKFDDLHGSVQKERRKQQMEARHRRQVEKLKKEMGDDFDDMDDSDEFSDDEGYVRGEKSHMASHGHRAAKQVQEEVFDPKHTPLTKEEILKGNMDKAKGWDAMVGKTLDALQGLQADYIWPRNTLFNYLRTMEQLQNNLKEYEDLQALSAVAVSELYELRKKEDSAEVAVAQHALQQHLARRNMRR
jgi:cation channel sperm-associated protein 2